MMHGKRLNGRLCVLAAALIAGGCAAGGKNRVDSTAHQPGSNDRGSAAGGTSAGNDADDPEPIAVGEDAPTEVVEEKYPSGAPWKRVEGKRTSAGEFVPDGLTTTWYESGMKWSETNFRSGVKHGSRRTWYTTGAEWSFGSYDNGVENGTWTAYHPNGEKAREWHIDHGAWDGTYTEWHPNGKKRMEVTFVGGVRQGTMNIYDESGKMAAVTDFIDGVEQP